MYIHRKNGMVLVAYRFNKEHVRQQKSGISGCYFTSTARSCVMISSHDIPWKVTPVPSFICRPWHNSKVCARRTDYDGDWSIHLKAGHLT